jgi:hypothetical protein
MRYFAYASNMNLAQMARRCPKARNLGQASLEGWELCFNRRSTPLGGGVAGIRKLPNSRVLGVLWDIGDDCLKALDRYEGFYGSGHPKNHYQRIEVHVQSQGRNHAKVLCYEAVEQEAHIPPAPRYLATILKGARDNQLPQHYIQGIQALAHGKGQTKERLMDPVLKKLRYAAQSPVLLLNAPPEFKKIASSFGTSPHSSVKGNYAFALAFVHSKADAEKTAKAVAKALDTNSIFWMAYPKGSSKKYKDADINRDSGHVLMEKHGFDGVSLVAIDEDWSAMRFKKLG